MFVFHLAHTLFNFTKMVWNRSANKFRSPNATKKVCLSPAVDFIDSVMTVVEIGLGKAYWELIVWENGVLSGT